MLSFRSTFPFGSGGGLRALCPGLVLLRQGGRGGLGAVILRGHGNGTVHHQLPGLAPQHLLGHDGGGDVLLYLLHILLGLGGIGAVLLLQLLRGGDQILLDGHRIQHQPGADPVLHLGSQELLQMLRIRPLHGHHILRLAPVHSGGKLRLLPELIHRQGNLLVHQDLGNVHLGVVDQLGQDHVLKLGPGTAPAPLGLLPGQALPELGQGVKLGDVLGKLIVQFGYLALLHGVNPGLEDGILPGHVLIPVVLGEGDVNLPILIRLCPHQLLLKAGDLPAGAQHHLDVLGAAPFEGLAVHQAGVVQHHHIPHGRLPVHGKGAGGPVHVGLHQLVHNLIGDLRGVTGRFQAPVLLQNRRLDGGHLDLHGIALLCGGIQQLEFRSCHLLQVQLLKGLQIILCDVIVDGIAVEQVLPIQVLQ